MKGFITPFFKSLPNLLSIATLLAISSVVSAVEVGSIPAQFDVSGGQASYSIPIKVAPGRGGMQPELAISYSSGAGNGIMGMGFNLTGLSSISRCPATLAQDGFISGITFTAKDRYCLDGQRLTPVSGDNGAVGTEYKTEVDTYSRIKSYGGSVNNPSYFVVETKAGNKVTYGLGNNSAVTFPQGNLSWSISELNDSTGNNPVSYKYFVNQNKQYLDEISYVGGKVEVEYENVSNSISTYFLGRTIKVAKHIKTINTYNLNQKHISYQFKYEYVPTLSNFAIKEITECLKDNDCLNPLVLDWEKTLPKNIINFESPVQRYPTGWNFGASSSWEIITGDFNGDGLADYGRLGGTYAHFFFSKGDGTFSLPVHRYPTGWNFGNPSTWKTITGDFNGDGLTDYGRIGATYTHFFFSNGDGTFSTPVLHYPAGWNFGTSSSWEIITGDFNGDGLTDFGRLGGTYAHFFFSKGDGTFSLPVHRYPTGWNFGNPSTWKTITGDFNGDGLTDYGRIGATYTHFFFSNGDGTFSAPVLHYPAGWNFGTSSSWEIITGDFNGDGLTDFGRLGGTYAHFFFSKGDGTFSLPVHRYPTGWNFGNPSTWKTITGDFNGDGLTDYARMGATYTHFFVSNGDGTFSAPVHRYPTGWNFGNPSSWKTITGDFNGDGFTDYARIGATYAHFFKLNSKSHKLTSITDSQNNKTNLTYKPLTDKSVYTKGTGAQYPIVDLQHAQYVVSNVTVDDGIGGTLSTNYKYEGLKAHVKGRGSYGFAKITETYPDTGKTKELTFDQSAFPLAGNPVSVVEKYNGKVINQSNTTYVANKQDDDTYQVYEAKTEQSSYELNGDLVTSVTAENSDIDEYGNVKTVKVTTQDNAGNSFSKTTRSNYDNNINRWHLGRLRDATITHQAPNTSNITRRSEFSYHPSTGLLSSEKVVSTLTNQVLNTTEYDYDNYGQKTTTSLLAANEPTRTSTVGYTPEGKPETICNALNQCSNSLYNDQGLVKSTTGPNQITTQWLYDGFGRKTLETRADGTSTSINYEFANSGLCGQLATGAFSCLISQSSGSGETKVQYDSLGREIRKITIGFDGRDIFQETEYNHLGQVKRVSRPYFSGHNIDWATSEYDPLGRVIKLTEPGPLGSTKTITSQYQGLTTIVSAGPKALNKKTIKNAVGKTIYRDEEEGAFVDYTYYADGSLHTTKTAGIAATTITLNYDEFGRKKSMQDPDMGFWQYSYTPFGQLKTQTDAKNQVTTNAYDLLGRMQNRTEMEGISHWQYYDNNAPLGSRGKLKTASGTGTSKTYTYDSLGRPKAVTTLIDNQSYITQNHYDSLGRVERIDYPGTTNFHTENIYNGYGFLEKVRGLRINSENYDLEALRPLLQDSLDLADSYLIKANQLRAIGQSYQAKLAYYKSVANTANPNIDPDLTNQLTQHQQVLQTNIANGNTLSPEFIGHLNNAIVELENVNALINAQVSSYDDLIAQLTILAEQTLSAADNSFHYANSFDRGVIAYQQNIDDSQYVNYWRALNVDSSGRISAEVYGNGITNDYTYNQSTGQLQSLHTGLLSIAPIRHLEYTYDAYNNVTYKDDRVNDIHESYLYDRLDRLTSATVSSGLYTSNAFNSTQDLQYNTLGNITYKSDVGDYFYTGTGPHAVTSTNGNTGSNSYLYDPNGNMQSGAGRSMVWNSFNKPVSISKAGKQANFFYGPSRARYKKINHQGDTTHYLGNYEKTQYADGKQEQKHYIYAAGKLVAEEIVSNQQGVQTRYLHQDALGSIDLVTDAFANVVDKRSFDAWGKLRDFPWKAQATINDLLYLTQLPFTNKGFTGHENIQEVGLIHMNGRVYDAELARFSSADIFIQNPWYSQSFNRYSYVWNNPKKFIDPTGLVLRNSNGDPVGDSNGNTVGTGNDIGRDKGGNRTYSDNYRNAQAERGARQRDGGTHDKSGRNTGEKYVNGVAVSPNTNIATMVADVGFPVGHNLFDVTYTVSTISNWWSRRTTVPSVGKSSSAGVGIDAIVWDSGFTTGVGIVKFDFNKDYVTDAWGAYYYNSKEVKGLDISLQLEYTYSPNNKFQGISREVSAAYVIGLTVSDPSNGQNPDLSNHSYTIDAGTPGPGVHDAIIETDVFMFSNPDPVQ